MKNTIFSNLTECLVGDNQLTDAAGEGWVPFSYELDSFSGTGLYTGARSPAGKLTLDLGLKGWQKIFLAHNPCLRVWLEGETGYCELAGDPHAIREVSLPPLDFGEGKKLKIAPIRDLARSQQVTLFFLKAETCDAPDVNHRKLIATNDGHGVFCAGMEKPEDIHRHIYPFRNSDFFRIIWGLYGGNATTMRTDTKYGESPLRNDKDNYYEHDWVFNESLQRFRDVNADPLTVVRQATREYGLELHFYPRMMAFYGCFPHVGWTTQFFKNHPQCRCFDEFGQPVNMMSYAYPQVQEHLLGFYRELLDYDPDGICLAFNRGLPLMICEEPVLEAYEKKYHRRPSLPEEVDSPEMLNVRHELLTDFVERVNQLLEKNGKELSCIVPRDFEHNRLFGLDAELLAKRGVVKTIMVGAGHGDNPALSPELDPVIKLKQYGVNVYAGGSHVRAHGEAWKDSNLITRAKHMSNILDSDLDGAWFWDAEGVIGHEWDTMRRFAHKPVLDGIVNGSYKPVTYDTKRIHDLIVGRYNPWHAY